MDAKSLGLLIGGIGMLAAIIVGGAQVHYGFRVFQMGHGAVPARTTVHFGKWKINTASTGVAIMICASFWALAAVKLRPTLQNMSATSYLIGSITAPVKTPGLVSSESGSAEFRKVLASTFAAASAGAGESRSFDLEDVRVWSSPTCAVLSVPLSRSQGSRLADFLSVQSGNDVTFVPIFIRHDALVGAGAVESMPLKDTQAPYSR